MLETCDLPSSSHLSVRSRKTSWSLTPNNSYTCKLKNQERSTSPDVPIRITNYTHGVTLISQEMKKAVIDTCEGLAKGARPQPIEEGMGGSYFVRDANNNNVAIFKPSDEEPCAPNNPKGLAGEFGDTGIKKGVRSGEQAVREVAAYLIDQSSPVKAGVPATVLVSLRSELRGQQTTKEGSFQLFVPSASPSGDFGASAFDLSQVQSIAALDMRLINTDRHDGNLLVQRSSLDHATGTHKFVLVPIDHGNCLPENLEVACFEWAWLGWPQANKPLLSEIRDAILNIDIKCDTQLLQILSIREECIRTMRLATLFLQTCVRQCPLMTLAQIGNLMSRQDLNEFSELERLVSKSKWQAVSRLVGQRALGTHGSDNRYRILVEEQLIINSINLLHPL